METQNQIAQIQALSTQVAQQDEAHRAAISAEREAAAAVLARVIEVARPALRALSSRIVRASYETGGRNGCNPVSRTEYHSQRGVCLIDEYERDRDETGNRGGLGGWQLYLLSDATTVENGLMRPCLALVEREGSFSHWQGEADQYETTLTLLTTAEVFSRPEITIDAIVSALSEKLAEQADGNKPAATKAATERAEKLRALAALLEKS